MPDQADPEPRRAVTAGAELRSAAVAIRTATRSHVYASVRAVRTIAADEARRVTGGDGRLDSGTRAGVKLGTRDTVRRAVPGQPITGSVWGRPAAGWVWRTDGTAPHRIRRRRRGRLARVYVEHPGATGRNAWGRVLARAARVVPTLFADELNRRW